MSGDPFSSGTSAAPAIPRTAARVSYNIVRHGGGPSAVYIVTYHRLDRAGTQARPVPAEGAQSLIELLNESASISGSRKYAKPSKIFCASAPPTSRRSGSATRRWWKRDWSRAERRGLALVLTIQRRSAGGVASRVRVAPAGKTPAAGKRPEAPQSAPPSLPGSPACTVTCPSLRPGRAAFPYRCRCTFATCSTPRVFGSSPIRLIIAEAADCLGRAERQTRHRPQVVLKLAGHRPFNRPVPELCTRGAISLLPTGRRGSNSSIASTPTYFSFLKDAARRFLPPCVAWPPKHRVPAASDNRKIPSRW